MLNKRFEGWYYKHQNAQDTLALIVGRAHGEAFLQVVTQERTYRLRYPAAAYRRQGTTVYLAGSRFGPDGLYLAVRRRGLALSGRLRYGALSPIQGHIMGPFRFLPMQCRHVVLSMGHAVQGAVCLNGKTMHFAGGRGYIEGDAGGSFPQSYTWVQCNAFARDCSIMAAVAHIPFAWSWFWGCICVVRLQGTEYRLATYHGAHIRRRDRQQLLLVQGELSLHVVFLQPQEGHVLDAPEHGRMRRVVREVPCAPAHFVFRRGGQILFEETSRFASYEHVVCGHDAADA